MKKLIKNVTVITMNENLDVIENTNILIENDIIKSIGSMAEDGCEVINGQGGLALPGLVNAHTHAAMTLLRGYADGLPLQSWLFDHIFPVEAKMRPEDIYAGTLVGLMDMLSSGTTLFADMYDHMDEVARAVEESGMKALLCRGVTYLDQSLPPQKHPGLCEGVDFCRRFQNAANGRIKTNLGPHAIYTTTPAFLQTMAEAARELGTSLHIHLSETARENEDCQKERGMTPTRYLYELGILDVPVLAAHCVHLTDEDIDLLKSKNVTVAHNPTSNLKLGSGFAPIRRLREKGVSLTLGTDGASSNNNLNMLEELHLAGLITNGLTQDPTAVTAADALRWGTNAAALGFADTGVLSPGKKADIVILDTDKPHLKPLHNALSAVVYSANAGDVRLVLADGKLLYQNGEYLTIDKEKADYLLQQSCKRIFS